MKIQPESLDRLKLEPLGIRKSSKSQDFFSDLKEAEKSPGESHVETEPNTYKKAENPKPEDPLQKVNVMVKGGEFWIHVPIPQFQASPVPTLERVLVASVHYAEGVPYPVVHFKSDTLPIEIKIEKTNGKLNITVFASDELLKDLKQHLNPLTQLMTQKINSPFSLQLANNSSDSDSQKRQKHQPKKDSHTDEEGDFELE